MCMWLPVYALCVCVRPRTHVHVPVLRGQKRARDPLQLVSQANWSLLWMLGFKLKSSAGAGSTRRHLDIPPAPGDIF